MTQTGEKIRAHYNASESKEIIFTSGTTHSINLVANGFSSLLNKGDEVLVTAMEHQELI